jgi:diaminopimelate epimerase
MDSIKIYKMSGAGNLFFVIDNRQYKIPEDRQGELIRLMYEQSDFQAEGIMFLDNSTENDFSVVFYNPDTSQGMMCGNGGRCAIDFANTMKFFEPKQNIAFEMAGVLYKGIIDNGEISIVFPKLSLHTKKEILLDKIGSIRGDYIENGTQHYCVNIKDFPNYENQDISEFPIKEIGSTVRYHQDFPTGVNFNIYSIKENEIILRTYERGVEAETGACGTGAIATAFASSGYGTKFPITIIPPSGLKLIISLGEDEEIILTGHTEILDSFDLDL